MTLSLLVSAALLLSSANAPAPAAGAGDPPADAYTVPGGMEHGRFFVESPTPAGDATLRLVTDTGGGRMLAPSGADKLGIAYEEKPGEANFGTTGWPYEGTGIPRPKGQVTMVIVPLPEGISFDGMLGAWWFGGRTWEWDYPAGTLRLLPDGELPEADPAHVVELGFQRNEEGRHTTHFPSIPAQIDGETLQFLFDTGATFRLDASAAATLGDESVRTRAGNFITREVMERWRERHPDWPYIEAGDAGTAMIQVPAVEIAGYRTGPAWFSARPDEAFHEYMAQWMDRPVDGALGGETFRDFRITVDYPSETAVFER